LGGLYKSMPWTTGFCIVGAASISAFPLFSGFISKSIIITEAARNDHILVWLCLIFASAGVFHHAGIKIPFFAFFAHDSGLRTKEAPVNMLIAMGLSSFLCIFLGCNHEWLYSKLPNQAMGYNPFDATHVITQLEILLFSALAFTLLNRWGQYPKELPSVNLDVDWFYRKAGRYFVRSMDSFWNQLNERAHGFFIGKVAGRVCDFAKAGHVQVVELLFDPMYEAGLLSGPKAKAKAKLAKRTGLGVCQVGFTALLGIVLLALFVFLAMDFGS